LAKRIRPFKYKESTCPFHKVSSLLAIENISEYRLIVVYRPPSEKPKGVDSVDALDEFCCRQFLHACDALDTFTRAAAADGFAGDPPCVSVGIVADETSCGTGLAD
jgi:hypothetical protein